MSAVSQTPKHVPIPKDLMKSIFDHLPPEELCVADQTNQEWRRVASEEKRWASLLKRDFPSHETSPGAGPKETYGLNYALVNNWDALPKTQVQRIEIVFEGSFLKQEGQLSYFRGAKVVRVYVG